MSQLISGKVELQVSANALWKCLSKDLANLLPKLVPKLISGVEILDGDGGLGSVLIMRFQSDAGDSYQKEKIVEMDDVNLTMANEVLEGGYKQMGFSYFKTRFQLKEISASLTSAECTVEYETCGPQMRSPEEALQASFFIVKTMEAYLLSQ
ncbi:hypothetical protein SUGI_0672380 [Cryptomeria japonica]|nr:hypothetical protein SUGI_0672380 [Cryptomeria japonica]